MKTCRCGCLLLGALRRLLRVPLLDSLPSDAKSFYTCGHAAVTRRLQNDFTNLLGRCAVVQCTFDVRREFRATVLVAE